MDIFMASNGGHRVLVTSRGLIRVDHPDPINAFKAAGVPDIPFDGQAWSDLQAIFKPAP